MAVYAIGAVPAGVDPDLEAALDDVCFAIACRVPKAQFASLDVDRDEFLREWHPTLNPRTLKWVAQSSECLQDSLALRAESSLARTTRIRSSIRATAASRSSLESSRVTLS